MRNPEIKDLIRQAQAAELEGDRPRSIRLLQEAAQLHLEGGEASRAASLLRHCLRLDPDRTDIAAVLDRAEKGAAPSRPPMVVAERGPVLADPGLECWCSFCCRPKLEVGAMIAGPAGAFICRDCLERCCEMAAVKDALLERSGAPPAAEGGGGPDLIETAVVLSRELGWSLADVRSLTSKERARALEVLRGQVARKG